MRKEGTGPPDALSSDIAAGYAGQNVVSGKLIRLLFTPLMVSSSLIFGGNSVVLPLVPSS